MDQSHATDMNLLDTSQALRVRTQSEFDEVNTEPDKKNPRPISVQLNQFMNLQEPAKDKIASSSSSN